MTIPVNYITKACLLTALCAAHVINAPLYAANPLAGVTAIEARSPMAAAAAAMLETHLGNILDSTGVFSRVGTGVLKTEMARFECADDECAVRFARSARLDLLVRGRLLDRGETLVLELYGFGLETPHDGRVIYRYRAVVPFSLRDAKPADYSLIFEEHAGMFLAGLLKEYRRPVRIRLMRDGTAGAETDAPVNGGFDVYRYVAGGLPGEIRPYEKIGVLEFHDNRAAAARASEQGIRDEDFILSDFLPEAGTIEEFYYGRKKELVFEPPTATGTLFVMLFSVPGSAAMPIVAPLGYYTYGDFEGLYLWTVNAVPYLYVEYRGLTNAPADYRDRRRDISRDAAARHVFAWYMLLAGGMPLFVDAFSHHYLEAAAQYGERRPIMGSSATAAYLSLVSNGGGHFYRGHRLWGYLYFHAGNLLLYYTVRNFTPPEKYNPSTGSYETGSVRRRQGHAAIGAFAALKLAEITHVLLSKDRIGAGTSVEERFSLEPDVFIDQEGRTALGIRCAYRF